MIAAGLETLCGAPAQEGEDMIRSAMVALFAATLLAACTSTTTTVFVVRHAERLNSSSTTPLSPNGFKRARALARVLGDADVSAIYATNFLRTQQTAQELATQLGLAVNTSFAHGAEAALVQHIKTNHLGKRVLVVGHSDTVDDIISELGGGAITTISDFDRLYVVLHRGSDGTKTIFLRYLRFEQP